MSACRNLHNWLNVLSLSQPNYPMDRLESGHFPKAFVIFTNVSYHRSCKKDASLPKKGNNVIKYSDLI